MLDEHSSILRVAKVPTTKDIISGVFEALGELLANNSVDTSSVIAVMFGTTHCVNAIVERKRLAKVGVLRIGKLSTGSIPPLYNLPQELVEAVNPVTFMTSGGHEYDGREIVPFNEAEVLEAARQFKGNQVRAVAISSVFSPVSSAHEEKASRIVSQELPSVPISLSSEIGSLGLISRENATFLNAALVDVAIAAIESFEKAVKLHHMDNARLFLAQNDGTVMTTDYARRFPVRTIACGPTNSIRGASFLTGITDGIVVDIGGTTTLVGALVKGFPRESGIAVQIGGVSTNFRMPDVLAIGCGGGTVVRKKGSEISIGPESVGYELTTRAVSWGGSEVTTTDIALASGYAVIEDGRCNPKLMSSQDKEFVIKAKDKIIAMAEDAVDRMKTTSDPTPVILVGGGGIIIPRDYYDSFKGASKVVRPDLFQYANAIGAANAQASGEVDRIFSYENSTREKVVEEAKEMSIADAIKAGSIPGTVRIVEVEQIPMSYVSANALRIRVKAIGDLSLV